MNFFNNIPLFSILILAAFLTGRIIYLQKKGVQVSSKPKESNNSKWFLFPVFGLIFLIWLFEISSSAFLFSFPVLPEILTKWLFESFFLKVMGTVLIFLSMILFVLSLVHFKTSLRFGLDEKNQGKLITTGIFSVSRNPFFLSLDIYFLGIALILTNLFFIGFSLLAIVSIHFFILKEEKFLRTVYGEEYEKYFREVGRYL